MLQVFDDLEGVSRAAARQIATLGKTAVAARARFDLLLAGGNTPQRTYQILATDCREDRDLWNKTHFYWSDERCVPSDHADSNYAMARRCLLDPLAILEENIYRIPAESADCDAAATEYEAVLPVRPDLVLLGVGADGHIASLFPNSPALEETRRRAMQAEAPTAPEKRITITPPMLRAARRVVILVSGKEKSEAVRRALATQGDVRQTPARLVPGAIWLVDRAAAQRLIGGDTGTREIG